LHVPVPTQFPTSLAFGGLNLDEAYITSALVEIPAAERESYPLDGRLYRICGLGRGLPEPLFAG